MDNTKKKTLLTWAEKCRALRAEKCNDGDIKGGEQWLALQKVDFRNANLKGVVAEHAFLPGFNFSNADMTWIILREGDLTDANLTGAKLGRSSFTNTKLVQANLEGANLIQADLLGANLQWAILRDAQLREARLENANLCGADMLGADLQDANLTGITHDDLTVWPDGFTPPEPPTDDD